MSVASNKLNNAIDGFLERMLRKLIPGRYPLQPIFVQRAIEKAITNNTKVFKNCVLPPNMLEIVMNVEDYMDSMKIEVLYKRELEEAARSFIRDEFEENAMGTAILIIKLKADPVIAKGTVTVRADHYETSYEGLK
jgi:hypothetical protein